MITYKDIEQFGFNEYHKLENSNWFEPLQIGAKWSRDLMIKELTRRQNLIISEPEGIVRDAMISNLLIDL